MNSMKSLIVLAVLAAGVVQALPQSSLDSRLTKERCQYLAEGLPQDGMMDSQDALSFLIGQGNRFASDSVYNQGLFDDWRNMLKNECSADSLRSIAVMNWCKASMPEEIIAQPLRAFTDKCLNSQQVNQHVETMSGWMNPENRTVLIDADFVADFRKDNPELGPLNLDHKALDATKAAGALAEALKRDFAKAGRDIRERNKLNPNGLKNDINERLIDECTKVAKVGINFATEIAAVGELWEGGVEAMIASLKPQAQTDLFRYTFCANIYEMPLVDRRALVKDVVARLQ